MLTHLTGWFLQVNRAKSPETNYAQDASEEEKSFETNLPDMEGNFWLIWLNWKLEIHAVFFPIWYILMQHCSYMMDFILCLGSVITSSWSLLQGVALLICLLASENGDLFLLKLVIVLHLFEDHFIFAFYGLSNDETPIMRL